MLEPNARGEPPTEAGLRLSKNLKTETIRAHNAFIFKSHFCVKIPKSDFFDSLVRRSSVRAAR
jgi:hypothetical protein